MPERGRYFRSGMAAKSRERLDPSDGSGTGHGYQRGHVRHQPRPRVQRVAITFSSIAIDVGRQLISNVVRHGGSCSKYSFHSRL